MLQNGGRCTDFVVKAVFDKTEDLRVLLVIKLTVLHFFPPCPFSSLTHLSSFPSFCSLRLRPPPPFLLLLFNLTHFFHLFFLSLSLLLLYLFFLPLPASLLSSFRSLSQGSTNSNMLDVQGGAHKKRVRRSSLLNAKKLYEDAQMARKVKQYLSNLTVETDEEKHQIMSLQCEPSYNTCK